MLWPTCHINQKNEKNLIFNVKNKFFVPDFGNQVGIDSDFKYIYSCPKLRFLGGILNSGFQGRPNKGKQKQVILSFNKNFQPRLQPNH